MNESTARRALLVGSLPFRDEAEAMQIAFDELGPWLDALPDGEIGERTETHPHGDWAAWVQTIMDRCEADTQNWEVLRAPQRNASGAAADYESGVRVKPRHRPRELAPHLDLGWSTFARQSYPLFRVIRERSGRTDLRFQVGLPTALGMTFGMMSPFNALRYAGAFNERLAVEANEILDATDGDVCFQLEVPGELAMAYRLPGFAVDVALRTVLGLVRQIRPEAPFGVHLCFGDLNNEALFRAPTLDKLVRFTNRLVARWPADRELSYLHVPLAEAKEPPPIDPDWYAPLADLAVPDGVRLYAGFVHEGRSDAEHARIRAIVEELRGHRVGIACSCGLGRRDRDTAMSLLAATRRLARS